VTLALQPMTGMVLQVAAVSFYAQETEDEDRRWYGWEADLDLSYAFRRRYQVYLQAARFEHGDRFENGQGEAPDAALLCVVGVRADF
jgi:hypothetical protein